jgi:S1-C subfamily serine protease
MSLIPEIFIDAVVAIGIERNGIKNWIGTGFLFGDLLTVTSDQSNTYTLYLVTNKHVFEELDQVIVKFNPQTDQASKDFALPLKKSDGTSYWTGHPDPDVDVAITPINHEVLSKEGMKFKFFQSDKHIVTITAMNTEDIREGNFIYVLGFPMGIISSDRQYVFARTGIISRIKDLYEKRSKDFVVDAPVFPGNSGGPVISKIENNFLGGTKAFNKSRLIGIIKSYIPYTDTAYSLQTKKPRITFEENSGLSLVEPVDRIIETIAEHKKLNFTSQTNN